MLKSVRRFARLQVGKLTLNNFVIKARFKRAFLCALINNSAEMHVTKLQLSAVKAPVNPHCVVKLHKGLRILC
ncbi:hypothetical protein ALT785_270062 [Alteromonas infernus]